MKFCIDLISVGLSYPTVVGYLCHNCYPSQSCHFHSHRSRDVQDYTGRNFHLKDSEHFTVVTFTFHLVFRA